MTLNLPQFAKDLLKSRRFWLGVAAIAGNLLHKYVPDVAAVLDQETLNNLSFVIGAWIVGESIRSSSAKAPVDEPKNA